MYCVPRTWHAIRLVLRGFTDLPRVRCQDLIEEGAGCTQADYKISFCSSRLASVLVAAGGRVSQGFATFSARQPLTRRQKQPDGSGKRDGRGYAMVFVERGPVSGCCARGLLGAANDWGVFIRVLPFFDFRLPFVCRFHFHRFRAPFYRFRAPFSCIVFAIIVHRLIAIFECQCCRGAHCKNDPAVCMANQGTWSASFLVCMRGGSIQSCSWMFCGRSCASPLCTLLPRLRWGTGHCASGGSGRQPL